MAFRDLIRYQKKKSKWYFVLLLVYIIMMIGMGGMYIAGYLCYGVFPYMAPMVVEPIPVILAFLNLFILPITTTLAEDGLYLGIGVNEISNKWVAVLLPAFFYVVQHCFIPTIWEPKYIAYRFLSFLPLTLFICFYYYKKRNPLSIMIGHALLDLATTSTIVAMSLYPEFYNMM